MTYIVQFSKRATRQFQALPRDAQAKLKPLIDSLATNPRPPKTIAMTEISHCYRIRQGNHRVIYTVRDEHLLVLVLSVGDRKEVYDSKEIEIVRKILKEMLDSLK